MKPQRAPQHTAQHATVAIGYVRVSTQDQVDHGISLDAQESRIRAYAAMRGFALIAVVIDAGVSAGKHALKAREGGRQVLTAIRQRTVGHVIALKLDRLFRDAEDALHHTKAWDKAGVSLHLIDLGGATVDTSSAMGRMFLTMMAGVAEMERNLIAERTMTALAHKRQRNERIGMLPYGANDSMPTACTSSMNRRSRPSLRWCRSCGPAASHTPASPVS